MMEKTRRLKKALAAYPESHHKAYPQFFASVTLATESSRDSEKVSELDEQSLQLLKKSFSDGSFQQADSPEISEILVHGWGSGFFGRNAKAVSDIARQAKGFEWLGLVLEGEYQVKQAWKARGDGWAKSVSQEGWKAFSEHLGKARAAYTSAWKLKPDWPLAPAAMITVSMAEGGAEEMRTWFDRAIAAQIDYPEAWSSMRMGLTPTLEWQPGSDAGAPGVTAVDTKRFDTDVPRKFYDVVSDLEAELEVAPGEHIYGRDDIWPHFSGNV